MEIGDKQSSKQVGIELADWNGGDVRGEGWCLRRQALWCVDFCLYGGYSGFLIEQQHQQSDEPLPFAFLRFNSTVKMNHTAVSSFSS